MEIKTTYTVTSNKGEYYDKTFDKMEEAEAFYINEQKINEAASKLEPLFKRKTFENIFGYTARIEQRVGLIIANSGKSYDPLMVCSRRRIKNTWLK